jgi:hypothetical protein
MVGTLTGRGFRPYAGPVAFLLASILAVGLLRGHVGRIATPVTSERHNLARVTRHHVRSHAPAPSHARKVYVVRAGDTIDGIAAKTGTPAARIMRLNPHVSPTALFIGEKLRLR